MERGADGKRSFIVSTYAAFWARYQGMLPQHRHYYEIIRQNWPCHLYFGMTPTSVPFLIYPFPSAISCMPPCHHSSLSQHHGVLCMQEDVPSICMHT